MVASSSTVSRLRLPRGQKHRRNPVQLLERNPEIQVERLHPHKTTEIDEKSRNLVHVFSSFRTPRRLLQHPVHVCTCAAFNLIRTSSNLRKETRPVPRGGSMGAHEPPFGIVYRFAVKKNSLNSFKENKDILDCHNQPRPH